MSTQVNSRYEACITQQKRKQNKSRNSRPNNSMSNNENEKKKLLKKTLKKIKLKPGSSSKLVDRVMRLILPYKKQT
jgi:hypothetical protein